MATKNYKGKATTTTRTTTNATMNTTTDGFIRVVHDVEEYCMSQYISLRKNQMGIISGVSLVEVQNAFPSARGLYFEENGETVKLKLHLIIKNDKKPSEMTLRDFDSLLVLPENYDWSTTRDRVYYVDETGDLDLPSGLCLSGGGLRAYFIHLGALKRLNEMRFLQTINTFTSVSGGSLLLGILAVAWADLKRKNFTKEAFETYFELPARKFAENHFASTVFVWQKFNPVKIFRRIVTKDTTSTFLAEMYEKGEKQAKEDLMKEYGKNGHDLHLESLFSKPLWEALPKPDDDTPFFVFCGCDMRNGKAFYFTQQCVGPLYPEKKAVYTDFDMSKREAMRLARVIKLSEAIAASSAYPLAFEPLLINYTSKDKKPQTAYVTDGGVYDNLGLDPLLVPNTYLTLKDVYNRDGSKHTSTSNFIPHLFVLVSDGGKPVLEDDKPNYHLFTTTGLRTIGLIGDQVGRLRTRLLKESFKNYAMAGTIWSINDCWEYLYDVTELTQAREEERNRDAEPIEKTAGVVAANEELKISEQTPTQELEEKIKTIFNTLPMKKQFPDLSKIFDINIDEPNVERCAKARKVVELITTIRTDLDRFYPEEISILVTLGYTLCAYKMRLYCFRELKRQQTSDVVPDPEFSLKDEIEKMNLHYFESSLRLAGSVLTAPLRYSIFAAKKWFRPSSLLT